MAKLINNLRENIATKLPQVEALGRAYQK